MDRITIHIRGGPSSRAIWILLCLAVLLLAAAPARTLDRAVASGPEGTEAFVPVGTGRHYYLTDFSRTGNTALTACTAGYYMASLWELYDVSNLKYDYTHPAAYTKADSGHSAPSHWYGWVRTGYDSSTANTAGTANCAVWTSNNAAHYGTIARLNYNWDVAVSNVAPWEPDTWQCAGTAPVWCVGYFHSIYLPLIKRK